MKAQNYPGIQRVSKRMWHKGRNDCAALNLATRIGLSELSLQLAGKLIRDNIL